MKLLSYLYARLGEASTYAGLAALCLAISSALHQSGVARWIALFGAVAAAIGAIAKSENNPALADAMEQAVKLVPTLTEVAEKVEGLVSAKTAH